MKYNYKLWNFCGNIYSQGDVLFTPDGKRLFSPIGNRIMDIDLQRHTARVFGVSTRMPISTLALSPNGQLLIAIDTEGRAIFVHVGSSTLLWEHNFRTRVRHLQFAPNGSTFAVTSQHHVHIWSVPPLTAAFRPLSLLRRLTGHHADVLRVSYSPDSQYLATASADHTARVYYVGNTAKKWTPVTLTGHRGHTCAVFWGQPSLVDTRIKLYTLSTDGTLIVWNYVENKSLPTKKLKQRIKSERLAEENPGEPIPHAHKLHLPRDHSVALAENPGRFMLASKHYFSMQSKLQAASIHSSSSSIDILLATFSNGQFAMYELPSFTKLQNMAMSSMQTEKSSTALSAPESFSHRLLKTAVFSPNGDWIAIGDKRLGALCVWEWKSELYVLKQRGHSTEVSCCAFNADGAYIATGDESGMVKVWNVQTGFCFLTVPQHSAPITSIVFSSTSPVLLSASRDGTIKAYDMVRYRPFRTFLTPSPCQFSSIAIDPACEIVCGASMDPFNIYVFSMQTGNLLDVCSGHEGPVVSLAFSSSMSLLLSGSWDKTVRLWDVFSGRGCVETLTHTSEVVNIAVRPDGRQMAAACLDGNIYLWDLENASLSGVIEGKKDIQGGRSALSDRTAANSTFSTYFTSLVYSADGNCLLAGGNSRFVCLYQCANRLLLTKFVLTNNLKWDGMLDKFNSRKMTQFGAMNDNEFLDSDDETNRIDRSLPGARQYLEDRSSRKTPPMIRTTCVRFTPSNRQWAAATTEGLLLYSLDEELLFDPIDLELDTTPASIRSTLSKKEYARALRLALGLNDSSLLQEVVENIPSSVLAVVAQSLTLPRVIRLLDFIALKLETTSLIEFYLLWSFQLLSFHGIALRSQSHLYLPTLRHVLKNVTKIAKDLTKVAQENTFLLEYLTNVGTVTLNLEDGEEEDDTFMQDGVKSEDQLDEMDEDEAEDDEEQEQSGDDEELPSIEPASIFSSKKIRV